MISTVQILEAFRDPAILAWIIGYMLLIPACGGAFGLAIIGPELWKKRDEEDI